MIGEKIKELRTAHNMSQEQLAEALDVTRQSVSKWETGKANPDMEKLIQLANLFSVSIGILTDTEDEKEPGSSEENPPGKTVLEKAAQEKEELKKAALEGEEVERLRRKLFRWRMAAVVCICVILAGVAGGSYLLVSFYPQISSHFGKSSIASDKTTVKLEHNNIFEDGIDGLLGDLSEKIEFPQYLALQGRFELNFMPDGTITSIETMWYGYDERYTYVDSYLIVYDSSKSDKITVYFDGGTGDAYDESRDMNTLFDALRLIPLEDSVSGWQEPEYGILYLGVRDWGYNDEGIVYLDKKGNIDIPANIIYDRITGPTVSVYCPGDETITPVRYVFCDDNMKERNVNWNQKY